jgi:GTP cyclohydrolase II
VVMKSNTQNFFPDPFLFNLCVSRFLRGVRGCLLSRNDAISYFINPTKLSDDNIPMVVDLDRDNVIDNSPPESSLLARIHSCCFTGETLGSLRK